MQDRAPALLWSGALAIVLALHATAAWVLLSHGFPPMIMPAAPEAVMLDLTPDLPPAPAALPPPPAQPPPETPPETLAEPPPPMPALEIPPVELPPPPAVEAEVVLPVSPPPPPPPRLQPKPKPHPVQRQPAPPIVDETPRPIQATAPAPVQAAPAQPTARPPAPASTVAPTWRSDLLARLQRAKRYPDLARSHGDQGVATVTFTMDRSGRVLSVSLVRGSGSTLLDDEAVALVRRAEPLPSLPEEMPGSSITLTVPISFALR